MRVTVLLVSAIASGTEAMKMRRAAAAKNAWSRLRGGDSRPAGQPPAAQLTPEQWKLFRDWQKQEKQREEDQAK